MRPQKHDLQAAFSGHLSVALSICLMSLFDVPVSVCVSPFVLLACLPALQQHRDLATCQQLQGCF